MLENVSSNIFYLYIYLLLPYVVFCYRQLRYHIMQEQPAMSKVITMLTHRKSSQIYYAEQIT